MKKAGYIIKIVSAALIFALGTTVMIVGLCDSYWYNGYWTSNEYYGGDAYTGIQNAAADTSRNVHYLGNLFEGFCNDTFTLGGILIMLLGIFMFGCTFASADTNGARRKKKMSIYTANMQAFNNGLYPADEQYYTNAQQPTPNQNAQYYANVQQPAPNQNAQYYYDQAQEFKN